IQCWDLRDMKAAGHIHELPEAGETILLVNAAVTGLGGNSCGPAPLWQDRVFGNGEFSFTISPEIPEN
ncbi:MAG: beta-galactosidase small subunit, partial [Bacteroidales bacterium]|nr:beta-galactosidase small subunit [Bacteroidales bacterium]